MNRWRALFAFLLFGSLVLASGAPSARAQSDADRAEAALLARRVTAHFDNGDVRAVLKALFNSGHVEYLLDPEVQGRVSVSITDVPLRIALDAVLKSVDGVPPLTYRFEDGVCHVLAQSQPAGRKGSEAGGDAQADPRVTAKIDLKNVDAAAVASILGGIAVAPDSIVFGGDTSAFGRAPLARRVYWRQPPDGASYYRSWSLGSGGFTLGPGGGLDLGGRGRGALGGLGGFGGLLR